jgi:adenylyl-sulfate kinase
VRAHLTKGLGFSKADRDENIRRIGWVAAMGTRLGGAMLVSAISPYAELRREVRARIGDFVEVYVKCSLDELIRRDPKGLYRKALAGEIANFTGVSDPYEEPDDPEIMVETDRESIDTSLAIIVDGLEALGYLRPVGSPTQLTTATAAATASGT